MSTETFDVYWCDPDGDIHKEGDRLGDKEAVNLAFEMTERKPGRAIGIFQRIWITSSEDDATVFDWNPKDGVVFPPRPSGPSPS